MVLESRIELRLSDRLEIIYYLLHGEKVSDLVDKLDDHGVSGLQKFLWEKAVEFGIICRGKHFDRREITRKMIPSSEYQLQQRCSQSLYQCKASQCIFLNSKCARKKIKHQVDVMVEAIWGYIRLVKQQAHG